MKSSDKHLSSCNGYLPRGASRCLARKLPPKSTDVAVAVTLIAGAGCLMFSNALRQFAGELLAQEGFSAQVHSLRGRHPLDAASTHQQTAKPPIDGELDFLPPVAGNAFAAFLQVRGRLDYLPLALSLHSSIGHACTSPTSLFGRLVGVPRARASSPIRTDTLSCSRPLQG